MLLISDCSTHAPDLAECQHSPSLDGAICTMYVSLDSTLSLDRLEKREQRASESKQKLLKIEHTGSSRDLFWGIEVWHPRGALLSNETQSWIIQLSLFLPSDAEYLSSVLCEMPTVSHEALSFRKCKTNAVKSALIYHVLLLQSAGLRVL